MPQSVTTLDMPVFIYVVAYIDETLLINDLRPILLDTEESLHEVIVLTFIQSSNVNSTVHQPLHSSPLTRP